MRIEQFTGKNYIELSELHWAMHFHSRIEQCASNNSQAKITLNCPSCIEQCTSIVTLNNAHWTIHRQKLHWIVNLHWTMHFNSRIQRHIQLSHSMLHSFNIAFNYRIQCCSHSTLHSIVAFNVTFNYRIQCCSHSTLHSIVAFNVTFNSRIECCTHSTLHLIIAFNVARIQHCIHSQANNHKITVTQYNQFMSSATTQVNYWPIFFFLNVSIKNFTNGISFWPSERVSRIWVFST